MSRYEPRRGGYSAANGRDEYREAERGRDGYRDRAKDDGRYRERERERERDRDREKDSQQQRDSRADRYHPYRRQSPPRRPADGSASAAHHNDATRGNGLSDRSNGASSASQQQTSSAPSTAASSFASSSASTAPTPSASSSAADGKKRSAPPSHSSAATADAAKKQAEAETSEQKPVFLSRKQREALALQRLEEERLKREEERRQQEHSIQQLIKPQTAAVPPVSTASSSSRRERDAACGRDDRRDVKKTAEEELREREMALLKAQHLGQRLDGAAKGKTAAERAGLGGKTKFHFEWSSADDTSCDPYALYERRHESALLFGRGFIGGVDRKMQRKEQQAMEEIVKKRLQDSIKHEERMEMEEEALAAGSATAGDRGTDAVKAERDGQAEARSTGRQRDDAQESAAERASASSVVLPRARADKESLVMAAERHWSQKRLEEMTERDWRIFKEDFEIATRGSRVPPPLRDWKESGLPAILLDTLDKLRYREPTPIQRAAIPVGLLNRDVIGIAETGSGKTAAFLLPMLVYISHLPPMTAITAEAGPYALIMAPTRELVQQISVECGKLGGPLGIRCVSIVGGLGIQEQGARLREGCEVVIGTPGRLLDCIQQRYLVLDQCNYIVLDEADRMIDMNFEPQINKVMEAMPSTNKRPDVTDDQLEEQRRLQEAAAADGTKMAVDDSAAAAASASSTAAMEGKGHRYRQTIMFSATMPPKVRKLAATYLRNEVEIAVGDRRGSSSANVQQRVVWTVSEQDRRQRLLDILQQEEQPLKLMVFCNLKRTCDLVFRAVSELGIRCVVLHGDKAQEVREEALEAFKRGSIEVLIGTDVVGRGIDIPDVRHVVNYEMPGDIQKYTHRIGRTGRAGKQGVATSFISDADAEVLHDLKQLLRDAGQDVPRELEQHETARHKPGAARESIGFNRHKTATHAE